MRPEEFFREKLTAAASNQNVEIHSDLEFYLVNLLCEFISPGPLTTEKGEVDILETPLALILQQAIEAPPSLRMKIFKYLGDASLYVAGFFQDYFNRKAFDVDYYITLGSTAYRNVSDLFVELHNDEHFPKVYQDLSKGFPKFVEVVAEVSEPSHSAPGDLLSIYDRWTRCNSERLRRLLEKNGITPVPSMKLMKQ